MHIGLISFMRFSSVLSKYWSSSDSYKRGRSLLFAMVPKACLYHTQTR